MTTTQTSTLERLRIIAYKDVDYKTKTGDQYEAVFNPGELVKQLNIEYQRAQGEGTTGTELKFNRILPEELTLNLLFDATGALAYEANVSSTATKSVEEQLETFLKTVSHFDGSTHNTPYLMVIWGDYLFKGKLIDLTITYTLFKPDGTPLRANAKATFSGTVSDKIRVRKEGKNSPDLTHVRTVEAGDTLPLMTQRIYGDFLPYLEVARVNGLKDFRNLKPGTQLVFPPINNQTK